MSLTARVSLPPHPLVQALHAEWTKLRTVAGPVWLLTGVVALTVTVGAAAAGAAQCQSATCGIDPAKVSFTGIYLGQAAVAVAGVLAVGNEYSTGMITLSLIAMPRRLTWFFAKAAVLTAPVLIASALAVAGSALAGLLILPGRGFTPAHGYAPLTAGTDRRRGCVPDAHRPAQPRRRRCGTRLRGGHRTGTRPAVPVPDHRVPRLRRDPRPAPAADRPPSAGLDIQATTGINSLPLTRGRASASSPSGPPAWPTAGRAGDRGH